MKHRKSLSPFSEKPRIISFTCLRLEFLFPFVNEVLKIIVCEKHIFTAKPIDQRCAIVNQTQEIEVLNDKIKIEIQHLGMSQLDLNTYQAFSLEKVPIYDKNQQKQLIGFLCFKIDEVQKRIISQASIQNSREQSLNFGSNLFTIAFSEQQQTTKIQNSTSKISSEEIKRSIDQIAQIYEEMSREQNSLLQQDLKIKKLDNEIKELNLTLSQLNEQEQQLDQQFKKFQSQSPQLQMLINQKVQSQYTILTYKRKIENPKNGNNNAGQKQQKKQIPQQVTISLIDNKGKCMKKQNRETDIPVNMSIPFSFNEYFSLFKN